MSVYKTECRIVNHIENHPSKHVRGGTYPAATDTVTTMDLPWTRSGPSWTRCVLFNQRFATGLCSLEDPQYRLYSLGGNVRPDPEDVVQQNGFGTEA